MQMNCRMKRETTPAPVLRKFLANQFLSFKWQPSCQLGWGMMLQGFLVQQERGTLPSQSATPWTPQHLKICWTTSKSSLMVKFPSDVEFLYVSKLRIRSFSKKVSISLSYTRNTQAMASSTSIKINSRMKKVMSIQRFSFRAPMIPRKQTHVTMVPVTIRVLAG